MHSLSPRRSLNTPAAVPIELEWDIEDALSLMVIAKGNGIDDTSSNPGQSFLRFTPR